MLSVLAYKYAHPPPNTAYGIAIIIIFANDASPIVCSTPNIIPEAIINNVYF